MSVSSSHAPTKGATSVPIAQENGEILAFQALMEHPNVNG